MGIDLAWTSKLIDDQLPPAILTKIRHLTTINKYIWCLDQRGLIYTFQNGKPNRAKFSIPNAIDIIVTNDGGTWLLSKTEHGIRLTDQLVPAGEITGLSPPKLIGQPTD